MDQKLSQEAMKLPLKKNWVYSETKKEPKQYNSLEELPKGTWLTIAEAAQVLNVSRHTVRYRFFTGRYRGAQINGGPILVDLRNEYLID